MNDHETFEKNYANGISLLDILAFIDAKEREVCANNHLADCRFNTRLVLEYIAQLPDDSGNIRTVYTIPVHQDAWDQAVKKHVNEG